MNYDMTGVTLTKLVASTVNLKRLTIIRFFFLLRFNAHQLLFESGWESSGSRKLRTRLSEILMGSKTFGLKFQPDEFWGEVAKSSLRWNQPFTRAMNCDLAKGEFSWFDGGKLNASSK